MEDAEFGLMLAAALDAIHAGEDEWSSHLLHNGNILALDNDGGFEWTLVLDSPKAKKRRRCNATAAVSETPKAKKQRIDTKVVAAPEKCEKSGASDESQASDEFEESAQKGCVMTRLLGVTAGASETSEASQKYVKRGYVIRKPLMVNPYLKCAMNHTDFSMMLGDAINAMWRGVLHVLSRFSMAFAVGTTHQGPTRSWKPWKLGQGVREALGSQG